MFLRLSTTGTASPVTFDDLAGRTFEHPTVSFDLLPEFTTEEVTGSADIRTALDAGEITLESSGYGVITTSAQLDEANVNDHVLQAHSDVSLTSPSSGQVLTYNGTNWINQNNDGVGENNTASNAGNAGIGFFDNKNGVDLEFRNINASEGISATLDGPNKNIDVTLDVNNLTALTTPDGAADFIPIFDTSAGDHKKILLNNITVKDSIVLNCGRGQNTTDIYLRGPGNVNLNQAPWRLPFECRLIAIAASTPNTETWDIEIYKDADIVGNPTVGNAIAILNIVAATGGSVVLSPVTIAANSEIAVYCNGTNVNRPNVTLWLERA